MESWERRLWDSKGHEVKEGGLYVGQWASANPRPPPLTLYSIMLCNVAVASPFYIHLSGWGNV